MSRARILADYVTGGSTIKDIPDWIQEEVDKL
jgi:hypothetical protein